MFRNTLFALIALCFGTPAFAIPSERVCDGKYKVAEQIVDWT